MYIIVCIKTADALIVQQMGERFFVQFGNSILTCMRGSRVDILVCKITVALVFLCIACQTVHLLIVLYNAFIGNQLDILHSVF